MKITEQTNNIKSALIELLKSYNKAIEDIQKDPNHYKPNLRRIVIAKCKIETILKNDFGYLHPIDENNYELIYIAKITDKLI